MIVSELQEVLFGKVDIESELSMYDYVDYSVFLWQNHRKIKSNSELLPHIQSYIRISIKFSLCGFYIVLVKLFEKT